VKEERVLTEIGRLIAIRTPAAKRCWGFFVMISERNANLIVLIEEGPE
jgi:hypothetical protein